MSIYVNKIWIHQSLDNLTTIVALSYFMNLFYYYTYWSTCNNERIKSISVTMYILYMRYNLIGIFIFIHILMLVYRSVGVVDDFNCVWCTLQNFNTRLIEYHKHTHTLYVDQSVMITSLTHSLSITCWYFGF